MMKKNERGSALVWAIVVIMVITIIIAAGLMIVQKNYNTSIKNASRTQAELSARSAIDSVVYALETGDYDKTLIPEKTDDSLTLEITLPENMGTVEEAYITLKTSAEDQTVTYLVVGVSTKYNNQTASMSAYLYDDGGNWKLDYYGGEEYVK
ncbi:hypothetical protein [Beduini massiliensis]|uniref:hypothetical protein n=2 Tax=Beduini massiliensis TaxID=1585974 RepID=UPI00164E74D2|nr:hypothetical protein [Beduini massiliensis]